MGWAIIFQRVLSVKYLTTWGNIRKCTAKKLVEEKPLGRHLSTLGDQFGPLACEINYQRRSQLLIIVIAPIFIFRNFWKLTEKSHLDENSSRTNYLEIGDRFGLTGLTWNKNIGRKNLWNVLTALSFNIQMHKIYLHSPNSEIVTDLQNMKRKHAIL